MADELGVFSALAEAPLSVADAATRFDLSHDWAEIVLGSLAAMELARAQDGRFHLTATARDFLLPDSPFYAGGTFQNFVRRDSNTEHLRQAMRNTETDSERYRVRNWAPDEITLEQAEAGARSLHGLSLATAVGTARNGDFGGVRRLLDVAGGAGTFAIAIAQHHPDIHCTVAELSIVCQVTQRYIREYGVEDQVDTTPLNMFFEAWPRGYDAILLSNVLHDWGAQHRAQLLRAAFEALPAGGRIYINEQLMGDAADGPLGPVLFSLNMRVGTAGKQFTVPELRAALETAGFDDVSVANTYGWFSLATGWKRA
ncbi:MAG: ubiquinone/menaquinone biosynthesis protein [Chloroflexi bacterium]|nr:ubiquinone/menaquinone biosynthesis protein [Chloroflexota bacterium]